MMKKVKKNWIVFGLALALTASMVGGFASCGKKKDTIEELPASETVIDLPPTDSSTPTAYTALENVGYMAYQLNGSRYYSLEMHGEVSTILKQTVSTYKQYKDGIMIMADLSESSMVKTAKQYCFIGDEYALWRSAQSNKPSEWNGANTAWVTTEPAKITIEDYKQKYGLPGTAFSVYVINSSTLLSASEVTALDGGRYSMTLELDPDSDATIYYRQQMKTTGGLDDYPEFTSIKITYTFDGDWRVLSSVIEESYSVKKLITAKCSAKYVTEYSYDEEKADISDYYTYYSKYAEKSVDSLPEEDEEEVTALGCLSQSFGSVLTEPAVFNWSATVDGEPVGGLLYADLSNMDFRAVADKTRLWFIDDKLYARIGDTRVCVSVEEITRLLGGKLVAFDISAFSNLNALDTETLLGQLGDGDFVVDEQAGTATLDSKLSLFGMEISVKFSFSLGDTISLNDVTATLSAAGMDISLSLSFSDEVPSALDNAEKKLFIPVAAYVETALSVAKSEVIDFSLAYDTDTLDISASGSVDVSAKIVQGNLTIGYGTFSRSANFIYSGNRVYLAMDDCRVSLSVENAASFLSNFFTLPSLPTETDIAKLLGGAKNVDVKELVHKLLTVDFGKLIALSEGKDGLSLSLSGTQLLQAFGLDIDVGDVTLLVNEKGISCTLGEVSLSLSSGKKISPSTENYVDLDGVLDTLSSVVRAQGITLVGTLNADMGGSSVEISVQRADIYWGDDEVKIYADLILFAANGEHHILLDVQGDSIALQYGKVGFKFSLSEYETFENALSNLYARLKAVADQATDGSLLPEIGDATDLLALLDGLNLFDKLQSGSFDIFDIFNINGISSISDISDISNIGELDGEKLLSALLETLSSAYLSTENGALEFSCNGLDLKLTFTDKNALQSQLSYQGEISLDGSLALAPVGEMISLDKTNFLTTSDFSELCDYVAAAAESLLLDSLTVHANTVVYDSAAKYAAVGGIKYLVDIDVSYYSGGSFPLHIEWKNKNLYLDTDMYAKLSIDIAPKRSDDVGLYLDIFLLDSDTKGVKDGVLDFYVRASKYASDDEKYVPLTFYAPADELMPVLSSAVALLGVDVDLLDDFFLSKWLTAQTIAEFEALGADLKLSLTNVLKDVLGDALGDALGSFGGLLGFGGTTVAYTSDTTDYSDILRSVSFADGRLAVTLSSGLRLSAEKGNNGKYSYLAALSAEGVNVGGSLVDFSLTLSPECERADVDFSIDYDITGLAALLERLAHSATHEVLNGNSANGAPMYAVNENFYIDGKVTMKVIGISASVTIRGISIFVNEGELSANVALSYEKIVGVIKAKSDLDMTVKDGMVYMRRTEYGDGASVVIYRAMPLENFFDDILTQMVFIFNFTDTVADLIAGGTSTASYAAYASTDSGEDLSDYGTWAKNYLSSYSYTADESGANEVWKFILNGDWLSDGVLGDISVSISTDGTGYLHGLSIESKIYSAIDVKTENMVYRNPNNISVEDKTTDIAGILQTAMGKKIRETDFTGTTKYIEGRVAELTFVLNGETLSSQLVCFDSATGTIYADIAYPDLSGYPQEKGYTLTWNTLTTMKENTTVYAAYRPNTYQIVLQSKREVEGFTYNKKKNLWIKTFDYVYGADTELPIGYTKDKIYEIVAFVDGAGKSYTSLKGVAENLTLTAEWEYIEYAVDYVADGKKVETQTAHYGDKLTPPAVPEKAGYTAVGWNLDTDTVTGNMTVTAVYETKTFTVTLVSDRAADGFELDSERGGYVRTLNYEYGTTLSLPVNAEGDGFILTAFTDSNGKEYTQIEGLLADTELVARWEEVKIKIYFVADEKTVFVGNYSRGDRLTLPEVPTKAGYTGSWQVDGSYVVEEEDTVYALYTPATYTVSLYSEFAVDGFEKSGDRYVSQFTYIYLQEKVTLSAIKTPKYDFVGYFDGAGEQVSEIYNITSDLSLYARWVDNTVTVTLCSDVSFDGCEGYSSVDGYYKTVRFNDVYTLSEATAEGYIWFGWWLETDGAWSRITDVKTLDGTKIQAAWISQVSVEITEAKANGSFLKTWTIGGTYSGGLPYGATSKEIFDSLNITASVSVLYRLSKDGSTVYDTLSGGKEQSAEQNAFKQSEMTSFYGLVGVKYAGATVSITYTYGDLTATTSATSWKSV